MFLGVCKTARGFDTSSYSKPLSIIIPAIDANERILDIEDAIVTDRMLKWGFHNPKLINKLLGGHKKVHISCRCRVPISESKCIAPSVEERVSIDHPITIGDLSYFIKRTAEGGIEMYNDGVFGYFDVDVVIESKNPIK